MSRGCSSSGSGRFARKDPLLIARFFFSPWQMRAPEGLLPTFSQARYEDLVQQLTSGQERLVSFSSYLRTGKSRPRPEESALTEQSAESSKTGALRVEVEMQLVYADPAASPAHQGGACGCGSACAAVEVCSTSSIQCPASSECLVLLHFWPCPDRTAQLEDHVRALQEQFEYTLDLIPTLVFIKDARVRRQDDQLHLTCCAGLIWGKEHESACKMCSTCQMFYFLSSIQGDGHKYSLLSHDDKTCL
jgi:hypothetical protein